MRLLILIILLYAFWIIYQIYEYKKTSYYLVTHNSYWKAHFNVGNYGEYLTYKRLRKLENDGGKFLFNVYLPKENGETSETDLLLLHKTGIFVFESKNYSGWIFGNESSRTWTQTLPAGKKSHKEHFLNPIIQNEQHIKWLKKLIKEDIPIHSIIVFSERCTLKKVEVSNVKAYVCKRNDLWKALKTMGKKSFRELNEQEIDELYKTIYPYTQTTEQEKQNHIDNIKKHQNVKHRDQNKETAQTEHSSTDNIKDNSISLNKDSTQETEDLKIDKCPVCGAALTLRMTKKGENKGKQFYGCSNFPKCRYIKNL